MLCLTRLVRRISKVETQIGAGLIEEVIQVAEGELKLVDTMMEHKVYVSPEPFDNILIMLTPDRWGELEEKPPVGQWVYFSRDQHTPGTQEPPSR